MRPDEALALLKKGTAQIISEAELSEKLAETTERAIETRKKLLKRLEMELKAHTTIEEELFYPALLDASDDVEDARMVSEGIEEHRACDRKVIPDLHRANPSTIAYSGEAKVLKDYIFHHLEEEEEEIFPPGAQADLQGRP